MNLTKRNILLPRNGQIYDLYDLPTAISRIVEIKVLSTIQSAIQNQKLRKNETRTCSVRAICCAEIRCAVLRHFSLVLLAPILLRMNICVCS